MQLDLLFADAAVEFVPKGVRRRMKGGTQKGGRGSKTPLLDVAEHGYAMKGLVDQQRRGRPDILHQCLLNALETPLAKTSNLNVFFHLPNGSVYGVAADTRVPRNYNRFVGVLAKLLEDGHVPADPPYHIAKIVDSLPEFLTLHAYSRIVLFSRTGTLQPLPEYFAATGEASVLCIIGAFQAGFFQDTTLQACEEYPHDIVSISAYALSAGSVGARVIYAFELGMGSGEINDSS
jgi:rRNA small subunit pseudouridine methyltransferase Nep1